MKPTTEILNTLPHFTGSETWTRWSPLFPKCLLTDGALYIAESCDAYWLMDAIASWQLDAAVKEEDFQLWILRKHDDAGGDFWALVCEDGNDITIAQQIIEFSDFPLDSIKLYAIRNEQGGVTILLPSEY